MKVSFTVPGTPVSKLRHRTFVTAGGSQRQYTPPETILYENMVAICCREAMKSMSPEGEHGTSQSKSTGAVRLAARFYFPVARTRAGRIAEGDRHTQRPDLDNCLKSIKDGLNGVAWNDDCCVAEITASKHWTHLEPKADITVEEI